MTSDIKFNISKPNIYFDENGEICEYVITESSGRCGCSLYYYTSEPDKIYIANVKVEPEYRRKGLATKMLDAVFTYIKVMQQFSMIYLWVEDSSWMEQWYYKLGFKFLYRADSKYIWLYFPLDVSDK